jgi:hypothetical protein
VGVPKRRYQRRRNETLPCLGSRGKIADSRNCACLEGSSYARLLSDSRGHRSSRWDLFTSIRRHLCTSSDAGLGRADGAPGCCRHASASPTDCRYREGCWQQKEAKTLVYAVQATSRKNPGECRRRYSGSRCCYLLSETRGTRRESDIPLVVETREESGTGGTKPVKQ